MKAKLILSINPAGSVIFDGHLELKLCLDGGRRYNIITEPVGIYDSNLEDYIEKLDDAINEATLLLNSIPGLKLHIDNTVYEFIDDDDDERVRKSINQLIVEI